MKAHLEAAGGQTGMVHCMSAFSRDSVKLMLDEDKNIMPHKTYALWSALLEYAEEEARMFKVMGSIDPGKFSMLPIVLNM